MNENFVLKNLQTSDDLSLIPPAWKEVYPLCAYKFPAQYQWIRNSPVNKQDYYPVLAYIDSKLNQLASWTSAIPIKLKFANNVYYTGLSCDTYTLKQYRCRGLGGVLQHENAKRFEIFASLVMSDTNRRNKMRDGAIQIGYIPILCKYLYGPSFKILGATLWNTIVSHSFLPNSLKIEHNIYAKVPTIRKKIKKIFGYYNKNKQEDKVQITYHNYLPDEIVEFIIKAQKSWDLCVFRNKEYLNWKYFEHPNLTFECVKIEIDGELSGWAFIRLPLSPPENCSCAMIMELYVSDKAYYKEIISKLTEYLRKKGAYIIMSGSSLQEQFDAFIAMGYQIDDNLYPVFKFNVQEDFSQKILNDIFLNLGDHDFEEPVVSRHKRGLDYIRTCCSSRRNYDKAKMLLTQD